jgi:type II secretory pathway pseudopilin PulG
MKNTRGFTLVEMMVAMAIMIFVIMACTNVFDNFLRKGGVQTRSAVSQIEGMAGLEMLRTDVGSAGFGLPWALDFTPTYTEAAGLPQAGVSIAAGTFNAFNETTAPRAIISGPTTGGVANPDYLVVKSALLALDSTAVGRWGFVPYSTSGATNRSFIRTVGDTTTDMRPGDWAISIQSSFAGTAETKTLKMVSSSQFSYQVPNPVAPDIYSVPTNAVYQPSDPTQTFISYGISDSSATALNMPYNRADYYVYRPAPADTNFRMPTSCNPGVLDGSGNTTAGTGTGILFKAVAGQNGDYTGADKATKLIYPLLSCVGDFRVVYNFDMNDDGTPDTFGDSNGNISSSIAGVTAATVNATMNDAALLRQRLKNVNMYILAHEGAKDSNYSYPFTDPNSVLVVGANGVGKTWTQSQMVSAFGADWMRYRWKVYNIAVNMTNLQ